MKAWLSRWLQKRRKAEALRAELATLSREAVACQDGGRYPEAIAACRRLADRVRGVFGPESPDYGDALVRLAGLLESQGEVVEAEPLFREALEVLGRAPAGWRPDYATGLTGLARLLVLRGEIVRAEQLLREALEIRREALGERDPAHATALSNLGRLLQERGNVDEAGPLLRRALEARDAILGPSSPEALESREDWARWLAVSTAATPLPGEIAPSRALAFHGDIAAELAALEVEFSSLAHRFACASESLRALHLPPISGLLTKASAAQERFARVRDALVREAKAVGLAPEADDEVKKLSTLQARARQIEAVRAVHDDAIKVVGRALELGSGALRDAPGCPVLMDRAGALRDALHCPGGPPPPPRELQSLADGSHPIAALLNLAEAKGDLDDAAWQVLYEVSVEAFGWPLAAAAARLPAGPSR